MNSVSKLSVNKPVTKRVLEASKVLRGNLPRRPAHSRKSFRARMADIERGLGLLLDHFDLK